MSPKRRCGLLAALTTAAKPGLQLPWHQQAAFPPEPSTTNAGLTNSAGCSTPGCRAVASRGLAARNASPTEIAEEYRDAQARADVRPLSRSVADGRRSEPLPHGARQADQRFLLGVVNAAKVVNVQQAIRCCAIRLSIAT